MFIVTRAGSDNDFMDPYPGYALIKIDQRTIDRAKFRIEKLQGLRGEEPHFLKAHFTDQSVVAFFATTFVEEECVIDTHDFNTKPILVMPDDFTLPDGCEVIDHHLETMLCYTDEFSFRAASAGSNTPIFVDTMFDPDDLQDLMGRRLHALVTDQGTAAIETCLCSRCLTKKNKSEIEEWAASDVVHGSWQDCTENEMAACVECGYEVQPVKEAA